MGSNFHFSTDIEKGERMNEELLTRLVDTLESINENLDVINSSLADVSVSLYRMEKNLERCISVNGKSYFLCITGNVSTN